MTAQIDGQGIRLERGVDGPMDVRIGGHRVWSFSPARDGVRSGRGVFVAWPNALVRVLNGHGEVEVIPHGGETALFTGLVRFGTSTDPLLLVDDLGNPLALDKGGRLQRTFDEYAGDARAELIGAAHQVLTDLVEVCGLDAYLCYGGLLGAARTGHMIGHDSDLDLAFLSKYTHPFDVIGECRRAERLMAERGWHVVRMSSANFKIWITLASGKRAGVDVFGSFHVGEHFHITGSLRGKLDRSAIMPFGEIELEGTTFPAPADVSKFLEFTYGPGWRTPDPSFHFEHPPANVRRMSHWFRGARTRLPYWQDFYKGPHRLLPEGPTAFAPWAEARMQPRDRIVELGSGTGRDAVWFAQQGHATTGSDYCGVARAVANGESEKGAVRTGYRNINLESLYSTLIGATRIAYESQPRHVYARGLIDALAPSGRIGLWRFCAIVGRRGGLTFLEFRTDANRGRRTFFGEHARTFARPADIIAEIERHGGHVVEQETGRGRARFGREDPIVCRLVVSWRKP